MPAFYSFCLIFSLALFQQPNQRHTPPFKIAIAAPETTIAAGGDVWVKVSLTNTSNKDVYEGAMYGTGDLDSTLRFEVRHEHGELVPQRTYPHPELAMGSVRFRTISHGETYTQGQLVSALYDLREPGKYTIQLWRRNPDYDIKSNVITITVIPNDKGSLPTADKAPQ